MVKTTKIKESVIISYKKEQVNNLKQNYPLDRKSTWSILPRKMKIKDKILKLLDVQEKIKMACKKPVHH